MVAFPRLWRIRQQFAGEAIPDVPAEVAKALSTLPLERLRPGQTVAIAAGSRGIANIAKIVAASVRFFRDRGEEPFVVPAMGSHAGSTAEGQAMFLAGYGITEAKIGAPVRSSMEVIQLGKTPEGIPVYLDKLAAGADSVLVVNRVKPHTDFIGGIESGLLKMTAIGLGKRSGAEACHAAAVDLGYEPVIRAVARVTLATGKIMGGLGILENGYDQTAKIVALAPEQFEAGEEALLREARALIGQLPFQKLHILVVDLMGKNISGLGMDPNVIGRDVCSTHSPRASPTIRRIYVRDLHPASHGNALGVGLADFCSNRLAEKIDWNATQINSLTATSPELGRLPLHFETDREALSACLATCGRVNAETVRLVRIRSTLEVAEFWASEALISEAKHHPRLSIVSGPVEMAFDQQGNLAN